MILDPGSTRVGAADETKLREPGQAVRAADQRVTEADTTVPGASASAEIPVHEGYDRRNYVEDACGASDSSQGRLGAC
jgi:hypothetical protein